MSYLYRPLAKISPTEEEGSRLGIGFELRIVLVLEERNEPLRDVASKFVSARRTRGFVYDLSRHGCLSARPTESSHLAAFFSRPVSDIRCGCRARSGARVLYLHGGVTRGKPPFYLRPAQAVWQLGLPATQGLHLVPAAPPHLQHADVRASHAKFQQRRLPRRAPSTGS